MVKEEEEEEEVYAAALWGTGGCSEEKYSIFGSQVALWRGVNGTASLSLAILLKPHPSGCRPEG